MNSYDRYKKALESATEISFARNRAEGNSDMTQAIEGLVLSFDTTFRFATGDDGIETATATADDAQAFLALVIETITAA
jgi:hypothetical protein